MNRHVLSWSWKVEGTLHLGAGISTPGKADAMIVRDSSGRPMVHGEAIKGAVRMAAERIACWLGAPQTRDTDATTEPCHPLFQVLFGGDGEHHYGGRLEPIDDRGTLLSSTAIDACSGTADDKTLRTIEVLGAGAIIHGTCTLWLPADDRFASAALTLLAAAIAAVEGIGANVGVGRGRLTLESAFLSEEGGESRPLERLVGEDRVAVLKELLGEPLSVSMGELEPIEDAHPSGSSSDLRWVRLTLELEQPVCAGARPLVANEIRTRDHLPASTLRGAFLRRWLREGVTQSQIESRIGPASRWSAAMPVIAGDQDRVVTLVPTPRSFLRVKGEAGPGGHGLHDLLTGEDAPTVDGKLLLSWRPVGEPWVAASAATEPIAAVNARTDMHVARSYESGSKRSGVLFSREALSPIDRDGKRVRFVAFVRLPAGSPLEGDLWLGKRRSAGHGRCTVRAEEIDGTDLFVALRGGGDETRRCPDDDAVFVQLLSPAVLRSSGGHPRRSFTSRDWLALAGISAEEIGLNEAGCVTVCTATPIHGWNSRWGHGRSAVPAIAASSVWRIQCGSAEQATTLRERLREQEHSGIGERIHEGFGWFVVDPVWLGWSKGTSGSPDAPSAPTEPVFPAGPEAWPGGERLVEHLPALLDLVDGPDGLDEGLLARSEKILQVLGRRARQAESTVDSIRVFCDRMALRREGDRRARDPWNILQAVQGKEPPRPLRAALDRAAEHGVDGVRLFLEFCLIRARGVAS